MKKSYLSLISLLFASTTSFAAQQDLVRLNDFTAEESLTYNSRPDIDSDNLVNIIGAEYNPQRLFKNLSPNFQGKVGFNILNNISGDDVFNKTFQPYGDLSWKFANGTKATAGKFKLNLPILASRYEGQFAETLYTGGIVSNIPAFSPNVRAYVGYITKKDVESSGNNDILDDNRSNPQNAFITNNSGAMTAGIVFNDGVSQSKGQLLHINKGISQLYADTSSLLDKNTRIELQGLGQYDRTSSLEQKVNWNAGVKISYLIDAQNLVSVSHNQNRSQEFGTLNNANNSRLIENLQTTFYSDSFFLKAAIPNYLNSSNFPYAQESASKIEYKNINGIFRGKLSAAKYYTGGAGKLLEETITELDASASIDTSMMVPKSSLTVLASYLLYPNILGELVSANAFRVTASIKF